MLIERVGQQAGLADPFRLGATLATVGSVVACIVGTFVVCASVAVFAWAVRSFATAEEQGGWRNAAGEIVLDAFLTYLGLGVAGIAGEGLKITQPIFVGGSQVAPESPVLFWLGRSLFGLGDALGAGAGTYGGLAGRRDYQC